MHTHTHPETQIQKLAINTTILATYHASNMKTKQPELANKILK